MLRLRLLLAFALVVLVAIVSFLLLARAGIEPQVRSFVHGAMMGVDTLANELEQYYAVNKSWQGVEVIFAQPGRGMMGMGGMMRGVRIRLADSEGSVLEDTAGQPQGILSRSERNAAIALRGPDGETAGYLLAEGGQGSPQSEQRLLGALQRAGLFAAAIAGVLSLLLAFGLAYGLLEPVTALTRAASAMSGGDLSQRVPTGSRDELGALGRAFNRMAESLQRVETNRRAMTADIAHELRTPIAIQRAHLEALQDGVYPLTQENLQPVLEQTELLARLVDDLRTLALVDAGELHLDRAPGNLVGLVRRIVDRFLPQAAGKEVRLAMVEPQAVPPDVLLDAARIEQILNNLISNALRYAPSGGEVQILLNFHERSAEVHVLDTGPGISTDALPRLFERFYRAEPSRSREAGGTGLGLAIARQLALAHGGDLTAENRHEGGAKFTLTLPYK